MKSLVWGIICSVVASWFWLHIAMPPLDELALIRHAQTTSGFITNAEEDVGDDDHGHAVWSHTVTFTYILPDGRELSRTTESRPGRLRDELRDLQEPVAVQVEYLPNDPAISRIKGDGKQTVFEWVWRRMGLGIILLLMFNVPAIAFFTDAWQQFSKQAKPIANGQAR